MTGVHGTARFAFRGELREAGLLPPWTPGTPPDGLLTGWWFENEYDFVPIAYSGDLHQLIIAGSGGGKFTTCIAPMLMGSGLEDRAVVVIDPKGEIANLVGPFFQRAFDDKPSVHLLDPWDVCTTGACAVLTFIDQLTADNPNVTDDARALADAMIIPSGSGDSHWENTARNFLTALLLYLALDPAEEGSRDLVRLRELVTMPWTLGKAYVGPKKETLSNLLYSYMENDLAGGVIRRGFTAMLNREDKERSGIVSILDRETAWIDSAAMARTLRGASLDLAAAARGGGKYFIVIPPSYTMTHRAWLRLCVTAFAQAFKRHKAYGSRPTSPRWRHIIIDEFPNLGEMSMLMTDIAVARGYDIKYHLTVQDLPQLRRVYGDGWESFVNNTFQRIFAVNDQFTADYVSKLLGTATVESHSRNFGGSNSSSTSHSGSRNFSGRGIASGAFPSGMSDSSSHNTSDSASTSWGESYNEVARPLCTPDEVRRLPSDIQIMIFRGMHPVWSWRPPYWNMFPSLPKFTLKQVLGTIGRKPVDPEERIRFERWRYQPLLVSPKQLPPPPEPEPPPATMEQAPPPPPPLPWWKQRRNQIAAGAASLLLLWFVWPENKPPPRATIRIEEPIPMAPPPVAAPVKPDPVVLMNEFIRKMEPVRRADLPEANGVRAAFVFAKASLSLVVLTERPLEMAIVIDGRDGGELPFGLLTKSSVRPNYGFSPGKDDPDVYEPAALNNYRSWAYSPDRLRITLASGPPYEIDLRRIPQVRDLWDAAHTTYKGFKTLPRPTMPCDYRAFASARTRC